MNHETALLIIELGKVISKLGRSLIEQETPHAPEAAPAIEEQVIEVASPQEESLPEDEPAGEGTDQVALESALNPDPTFYDPRLPDRSCWAPDRIPAETAEEARELCKALIGNILAIGGQQEGGRSVTRCLWRFKAQRLNEIPDHLMIEAAKLLAYGANECRAIKAFEQVARNG